MAAYDGESSNPFPSFLQCDDNGGTSGTSRIDLDSPPNVVYFQVGGKNGASGNLVFNLDFTPSPANDNFANASVILAADLPYSDSLALRGASRQGGDGLCPDSQRLLRSVWYSFTPVADMDVVADTLGSDFDTGLMAALAGSNFFVTALYCNDDDGALETSALTLHLTANTTYYFQVGATYDDDSKPVAWKSYGDLVFRLSQVQSATAGAGDTFPASIDATPGAPVAASVTTPNGGDVSISVQSSSGIPPDGYGFLGQQLVITAPDASPGNPLVLVFQIDDTVLDANGITDVSTIAIYRNGVGPIGDCQDVDATPDPCVASKVELPDGDAEITIRTSAASLWQFAVQLEAGDTQALISGVRDDLAAQNELTPHKRLAKAIGHLDNALAGGLWVDDTHLDPEQGKKVFNKLAKAVHQLAKIKGGPARDAAQAAIDDLVEIAAALAQTAVDEAPSGTWHDKATSAMANAASLASGHPIRAVRAYRLAWAYALKA